MKQNSAVAGRFAVLLTLAVAVFSLAVLSQADAASDVTHLEMSTTSDTPAGFEEAKGRIKFNSSGTTLTYALKASGLGAHEDYLVVFCDLIVGAGTSDKNGSLESVGSANGSWYLESEPDDAFELYRVSEIANYPFVSDLELILRSPESGYDWTQ